MAEPIDEYQSLGQSVEVGDLKDEGIGVEANLEYNPVSDSALINADEVTQPVETERYPGEAYDFNPAPRNHLILGVILLVVGMVINQLMIINSLGYIVLLLGYAMYRHDPNPKTKQFADICLYVFCCHFAFYMGLSLLTLISLVVIALPTGFLIVCTILALLIVSCMACRDHGNATNN